MRRDRSQAIVIRKDRILLVKHHMCGREFYALPGGGLEKGETPEQAAIRELQEECNVSGEIIRPTSTQYKPNNQGAVYSFYVSIPDDAVASPGRDPEVPDDEQTICGIKWCTIDELSRRDQIALWSAGLFRIEYFYNLFYSM